MEELAALVREFPRDYKLQTGYALNLIGAPLAPNVTNDYINTETLREGVRVLERIIAECGGVELCNKLTIELIRAHYKLGEHATAYALADKLPKIAQSQEMILFELRSMEVHGDAEKTHEVVCGHASEVAQALTSPMIALQWAIQGIGIPDEAEYLQLLAAYRYVDKLAYTGTQFEWQIDAMAAATERTLAQFYVTRDLEKAAEHFARHVDFECKMPSRLDNVVANEGTVIDDEWRRCVATAHFSPKLTEPLRGNATFEAAMERYVAHQIDSRTRN